MAVLKRCSCGEPLAKTASEPGGIVHLGTVITFDDRSVLLCKRCRKEHPLALTMPRPAILPDRLPQNR